MSTEQRDAQAQAMIAAVWRAVAKACAATTPKGHFVFFAEDCAGAIKTAEYVEKMILITKDLHQC